MSLMRSRCMLHQVSAHAIVFSSECLDCLSSRCRRISPFTLRVRLPTICARHVQSTRFWKGRHYSCCSCYRCRVPRVRSSVFSASYNCLCHPMRLDHFYSGSTANVYDTQADMLRRLPFSCNPFACDNARTLLEFTT